MQSAGKRKFKVKRAFITTVAGMSSRFCADLPEPLPKCIYNTGNPEKTLLYRLVTLAENFDKIIVVVGFMKDTVTEYAEKYFPKNILCKTVFVNNIDYSKYGSGWSLFLGLDDVKNSGSAYDEIVFAEGDLFFRSDDFQKITDCKKNVLTVSRDHVLAEKSVAVYLDSNNIPKYVYDTSHGLLEINEPFRAVFNSAQIWKFRNTNLLFRILDNMTFREHQGTNLVLMNKYFGSVDRDFEIISMENWLNCNTVHDFETVDGLK